ncbi:hypothetical protein HDU76_008989, partial [Blyttiomyces sp. JEL0837]
LSRPPDQFIEKELGHSFGGDSTGHEDWAEKKVRSSRAFDSFVDTLRQHYPANTSQGPQVVQNGLQTTCPTQDHRAPIDVGTSIHQTSDSISLAAALVKKNVTKGGGKATTSSKEKMAAVKRKLGAIGEISTSTGLTPPHSAPSSPTHGESINHRSKAKAVHHQEQSQKRAIKLKERNAKKAGELSNVIVDSTMTDAAQDEALGTTSSSLKKREPTVASLHEKIPKLVAGDMSDSRSVIATEAITEPTTSPTATDAEKTLHCELNHEKSKRTRATSRKGQLSPQAKRNQKQQSTTEQMHIDIPVAEANRHFPSHVPKADTVMATRSATNQTTDPDSRVSAGTVAPLARPQAQTQQLQKSRQSISPTHDLISSSKSQDIEMEESEPSPQTHDVEMEESEPSAQIAGFEQTSGIPQQQHAHQQQLVQQGYVPLVQHIDEHSLLEISQQQQQQIQPQFHQLQSIEEVDYNHERSVNHQWQNAEQWDPWKVFDLLRQASDEEEYRTLRSILLEIGYFPLDDHLIFLGDKFICRIWAIVRQSHYISCQIMSLRNQGVDYEEVLKLSWAETARKIEKIEALVAEFMARYEHYQREFGGGTPPHGQDSNGFQAGTTMNYGHSGNATHLHEHTYTSPGNEPITRFHHQEGTEQIYHGHEANSASNNVIPAGGLHHSAQSFEPRSPDANSSHVNNVEQRFWRESLDPRVSNMTTSNENAATNGQPEHCAMDTNALQNVSVRSDLLQNVSSQLEQQESEVLTPVHTTANEVVAPQEDVGKNDEIIDLKTLAKDGVLLFADDDEDLAGLVLSMKSSSVNAWAAIKKLNKAKSRTETSFTDIDGLCSMLQNADTSSSNQRAETDIMNLREVLDSRLGEVFRRWKDASIILRADIVSYTAFEVVVDCKNMQQPFIRYIDKLNAVLGELTDELSDNERIEYANLKSDMDRFLQQVEAAKNISLSFRENRLEPPLMQFQEYLLQMYFSDEAQDFKQNITSLTEMEAIVSHMEKEVEGKKLELQEEYRVWGERWTMQRKNFVARADELAGHVQRLFENY